MSARGHFGFADLRKVEMTANITMTVQQWRELKAVLEGSDFGRGGGWTLLHKLLPDLLRTAEKDIWAHDEGPET